MPPLRVTIPLEYEIACVGSEVTPRVSCHVVKLDYTIYACSLARPALRSHPPYCEEAQAEQTWVSATKAASTHLSPRKE